MNSGKTCASFRRFAPMSKRCLNERSDLFGFRVDPRFCCGQYQRAPSVTGRVIQRRKKEMKT